MITPRRVLTGTLLTLLMLACEGATTPEFSPSRPNASAFVTPAVQQLLDDQGNFVIRPPTEIGGRPVITLEEARELASELVRIFLVEGDTVSFIPGGVALRTMVNNQHSALIDWSQASLGEAQFAWAPLAPLSDEVPGLAVNFWGPHFLLPIVTDVAQIGTIAIAAHALGISLTDLGALTFAPGGGNTFFVEGVPYFATHSEPLSPEAAVREIGGAFGALVDRVPRLLSAGLKVFPISVRWEVHMERPVAAMVLSSGEVMETNTLYVGVRPSLIDVKPDGEPSFELRFFIADAEQPERESVLFLDPDGELVMFEWPYTAPVRFFRVAPL